MHFKFLNVNDAFHCMVRDIQEGSIPTHKQASRYGEVLTIEEPTILTYRNPRERVLFNAVRDCNPAFQLYEGLYMLAGRNDVAPLVYYNSRMKEFSDDGVTLNGSYGYRWRYGPYSYKDEFYVNGVDQIHILIQHLKANPFSRRAVLQMWDVENDLLKIGLGGDCNCGADRSGPSAEAHDNNCPAKAASRDVCCNLSVKFKVRQGMCPMCDGSGVIVTDEGSSERESTYTRCSKCYGMPYDRPRYLDITVFNRSNDLIWGCLGTNYIQFSVLQEYMAAHLGLEVGVYNQISDDLHVYTNNWKPEEWLEWGVDVAGSAVGGPVYLPTRNGVGPKLVPLVQDPAVFDKELPKFVDWHSKSAFKYPDPYDKDNHRYQDGWQEPFLRTVAEPMMLAFHVWKQKEYKWQDNALHHADKIAADDWRIACRAWLERRITKTANPSPAS